MEPDNYKQIIEEHGNDGWKLIQIFAPYLGGIKGVHFYELIFEREIE